MSGAWRRAVRNDCGANTVGGTQRQELGTLGPSVFRQPRKPTVTGPPRPLVLAVMERSPRGPYPLLCGPVAAWAHFRAEWCRFSPHTLERKAPSEDALEEPRRTAWRPTCKPQGAGAGGFRGGASRPAQCMLGAWGRIRAGTEAADEVASLSRFPRQRCHSRKGLHDTGRAGRGWGQTCALKADVIFCTS